MTVFLGLIGILLIILMAINDLQAEMDKAMDMVFDHFQRSSPVTFYKSAAEEIVAVDPSWNSDFTNPYAENIVKTSQSKEILCRFWYLDGEELLKSFSSDDIALRLTVPVGRVKIQIKTADLPWLKHAKCFYVLGERFVKDTDWRGLGSLQRINRYEITLRKDQ